MLMKRHKARVPKTKTFTGCWTCRKRSLKCDATHPVCMRCQRAGLHCEGYHISLRWINDAIDTPATTAARMAQSLLNLPQWSYEMHEVDEFLDRADHDPPRPDCGPFFVFQIDWQIPECFGRKTRLSSGHFLVESAHRIAIDPNHHRESKQSTSNIASSAQKDAASHAEQASTFDTEHDFLPDTDFPIAKSPEIVRLQDLSLIRQPACFTTRQTTHLRLLHNYVENIAQLLQPLPCLPNHYSNAYVPRAILGSLRLESSQIEVQNSCNNIAVLFAVLSISAFHLRGNLRDGQLDETGQRLRRQAFLYLRRGLKEIAEEAVQSKQCGKRAPLQDYRDAMSAMLSLVTADVMDGRMSEYWIHLEGVRELSRHWPQGDDTFLSMRLMTVANFLNVLSETTMVDPSQRIADGSSALPINELTLDRSVLLQTYGVTPTLVRYMAEITRLSQELSTYNNGFESSPEILIATCQRLSCEISLWSLDQDEPSTLRYELPEIYWMAHLHTRAFACALQVYMHTRTIGCSAREMAEHVNDVATCLNEIERLKETFNSKERGAIKITASLAWPGFIASCEAEQEVREPWYQWWWSMLGYGIGNIFSLWQIVQDAWILRDAGSTEIPAWAPVLRNSERNVLAV